MKRGRWYGGEEQLEEDELELGELELKLGEELEMEPEVEQAQEQK